MTVLAAAAGNDAKSRVSARWIVVLSLSVLIIALSGCGDPPRKVAINKQELSDVRDGTFAVLNSGYTNLLKHAAQVRNADLEKAGRKIDYDDLIAKPAQYRGELIIFEGLMLRLFKLPADPNDLPRVNYEAWIVTDDSQPYRVVFSELPDGLKPGQKLRPVRAVGYFYMLEGYPDFRLDGYPSDDQIVTAPVLLARRVVPMGDAVSNPGLKIRYATSPLNRPGDVNLPDIRVGLRSDLDGNLTQLTLGGRTLGIDDAAFEQLNREILKIIGRPGHPATKDIGVRIDVDFECQYKYVETAVAKCMGRVDEQTRQMVRYIENIDFEPPRNPQK